MASVDALFDYQFRIIVIGDSMVGKTSLIRSFVDGKFSNISDPTVGVDFFTRIIDIGGGVKIKLQIWDSAGQEKFRSITKSYYRNSVGVVFVYDITNQSTFAHLVDWIEEAKNHIEHGNASFVVVGHKVDASAARAVSAVEGQAFADFHGARFIEASARTGSNIDDVFVTVAHDIYDLLRSGRLTLSDGTGAWDSGVKAGLARQYALALSSSDSSPSKSDGCCGGRFLS